MSGAPGEVAVPRTPSGPAARVSSVVLVLLALSTALVFSPFQTDAAILKAFVAEGLVLFGVAALAIRAGSASDGSARDGLRRALLAAGPLAAAGFISVVLAGGHWFARIRLEEVLVTCAVVALAASAPRGTDDARRTALALAIGGALAVAYGAAQVFGVDFVGWTGPTARPYRFRSTFGHHSLAAAFLLAAIAPAAGLAAARSTPRKSAAIALFASLVLAAGLVLSLGRGAWTGFVAASAVLAVLLATRAKRSGDARSGALLAVAAPSVLFLGASLLAQPAAERWLSFPDLESSNIRSRLLIYEDSLAMIREKPFLGHGIGLFPVAYPRYRSAESQRNLEAGDRVVDHAHDEFLEVAAEQGVVGLAAFLWFLGAVFARGLRRRGFTALDAGLVAAASGLLVHNLFDVNLRATSTAVPFALAAGFLLRPGDDDGGERPAPRPGGALARTAGLLVAILALASVARPVGRALADADLHRASLLPPSTERAEALQAVADAHPGWPEALYRAGYASLREALSGGPEARRTSLPFAVKDLEALRRISPYHANMPLPLAQALEFSGRTADAIEAVRDFLRAHPFDAVGHRFLADLLEKEKRTREALVACENAVACAPFEVENYARLGRIRESLGMTVEASAAWFDAAALAPRRPEFRLALARSSIGETQLDQRLESLFVGLEMSRGNDAALNLLSPLVVTLRSPMADDRRTDFLAAILARFRGNRDEALARYRSFAEWAGKKADDRLLPAVDLATLGDWERADRLFDEAEHEVWARIDPWRVTELASADRVAAGDFGAIRDAETRFHLGLALARHGKAGVALDVWQKAALEGRPLRLLTAGEIALRAGRADEARAYLEAAAEASAAGALEALDDPLHGSLRSAEISLGPRLNVADRTLEDLERKAGAKNPEPWDLYLRANLLETLGRAAEAAEGYRAVLDRDRAHWLALDGLARLGAERDAEEAAARALVSERARALLADGAAAGAPGGGTDAIAVGRPSALSTLGTGWSRPDRLPDESLFRWAIGPRADAAVEVGRGSEAVEIEAIACEGLAARLTARLRGVKLGEAPLVSSLQRMRFPIPAEFKPGGTATLVLSLEFDRWASPRERTPGRSPDAWPKAAGVKAIRVR